MAFKLTNLSCDGACVACDTPLPTATRAWWDQTRIEVVCTRCRPIEFEPATVDVLDLELPSLVEVGAASSAHQNGGGRPHTGIGFGRADELAIDIMPWRAGVTSGQTLGPFLDEAFIGHGVVLHDRAVDNGSVRGNIDHVVIAASGVWVIDAKNCAGVVEVRRDGPANWKPATSMSVAATRPSSSRAWVGNRARSKTSSNPWAWARSPSTRHCA